VTKNTLHCGVAADALLAKKAYAHLIEPFDKRKKVVEDFLKTITPHLKINVFQLDDACGVGATLPEIEACVLTQETAKGGNMINEARAG
jgi:pantetheine-phosphate adenylyltransferase